MERRPKRQRLRVDTHLNGRETADSPEIRAWNLILRTPSAWIVSPGGSGMLNYLRLRTTAKYVHKCVVTNWVNLQTMWRILPRLQAWLHRPNRFGTVFHWRDLPPMRLLCLERTIRIMCECSRQRRNSPSQVSHLPFGWLSTRNSIRDAAFDALD